MATLVRSYVLRRYTSNRGILAGSALYTSIETLFRNKNMDDFTIAPNSKYTNPYRLEVEFELMLYLYYQSLRKVVSGHFMGGTSTKQRLIVGNPNRKKMHIFGFVGIFEYIC